MSVVLLTLDLTVISLVDGAAKMCGVSVRSFSSIAQAAAYGSWGSTKLLIVDLTTPSLNLDALMKTLREYTNSQPRVVAFGPHVHAERLAAAREAGCDDVMSRGEFFARASGILQARS